MTPGDSRGSVRKSAKRSRGDKAKIGRVQRIGLTLVGKRDRLREDEKVSHQRLHKYIVLAWSLGLVLLALGVMGGIVGYWIATRPSKAPPATPAVVKEEMVEKELREVFPHDPPAEAEALSRVKEALAIRQPDQVKKYFQSGGNSPEQVIDFLKALPSGDQELRYQWLGSMNANGLQIEAVSVLPDAEQPRFRRLALLTPDESGTWMIDFDALAETTTPGWDAWRKPGPLEGVMRIGFLSDVYYNGLYQDDGLWACYTVHAADAEQSFFAYCKRGSDQHRALEAILAHYENSLPILQKQIHAPQAVIAVSRREDGNWRQLEINRVIAEGWIVGPTPFEEGFRKF